MGYSLRPFTTGDAKRIAIIFDEAVRVAGAQAYSPEQVAAWLSRASALEARILERAERGDIILVMADDTGEAVAYALLEPDGHLDHLYCHPSHTRRGLADRLLQEAEERAIASGARRLFAEASELARPAFERAGYVVTHKRDFSIAHEGREVPIHNYAMEKSLG